MHRGSEQNEFKPWGRNVTGLSTSQQQQCKRNAALLETLIHHLINTHSQTPEALGLFVGGLLWCRHDGWVKVRWRRGEWARWERPHIFWGDFEMGGVSDVRAGSEFQKCEGRALAHCSGSKSLAGSERTLTDRAQTNAIALCHDMNVKTLL